MRILCAIIFAVIYKNVEFITTAEIRTKHNETARVYDTIVVGVGAAGSAALGKLARAGRSVLGLEAADRVGGRVRTVPFGHGVVEVGAEWIHGTNNSVTYELAVANNIPILNQDGDRRAFRSNGTELDKELVMELHTGCTDDANITQKDQSIGEYYTEICKDYIAKNQPELMGDDDFVSSWLDYVHFYVASSDAADDWSDVSTRSTYQNLDENLTMSWHKFGYKTVFDIILNKYNNGPGLPNAEIKLNKEVTQVVWSEDPAADVVVKCADGTEYRAKNVIVTVSLGVLKHSYNQMFSPSLPEQKIEAIKNISMGLIGKIILSFEERWWAHDFVNGFLWSKEDKEQIPQDEAWTAKIGCTSPSMGSDNVLVLWTNGATTRHVETLSDEVVKKQAMKLLRRFMGPNITEATGMIKTTWYSNPFTRGTYTFDNLDMPKHPLAREDLARPLLDSARQPRVLFAGEATNTPHYGTVHGAVETGIREANRLLGVTKMTLAL